MPGLLPGCTRKGIEQLPIFFYGYGSILVEMLNVLYILEALRLACARLSDSIVQTTSKAKIRGARLGKGGGVSPQPPRVFRISFY